MRWRCRKKKNFEFAWSFYLKKIHLHNKASFSIWLPSIVLTHLNFLNTEIKAIIWNTTSLSLPFFLSFLPSFLLYFLLLITRHHSLVWMRQTVIKYINFYTCLEISFDVKLLYFSSFMLKNKMFILKQVSLKSKRQRHILVIRHFYKDSDSKWMEGNAVWCTVGM